ncbi:hypothetical protein LTR70_010084 [Exophiala xenobiotica]|uniref:Xylanolytic transcriptional activator regulatory domain-containing protein n=1 Tax=Lithohypha guttulata TaxID=1690604 RepID=A0ABR0JX03_9EURO|nr:hypothetical protein LTR24_010042 [Lithohypha guttulata]KAK5309674.1 hypothetical protein LTR70_010084 [Exophiala xenobiotica]
MAVCALSSARVRDTALFNPFWSSEDLADPPSETFYNAAIDNIPHDETPAQSLSLMKTYALLALTAIQYGNIRHMQAYLGRYHTLVEMDSLHDETNWPSTLTAVELEERRRLFWSMYTLDVFSSIVWNSVIRVREQQCNVRYTTELDDLHIDDHGYRFAASSPVSGPSPPGNASGSGASWLQGWNATTDLWRILEHATLKLQSNPTSMKTFLERSVGLEPSPPGAAIQDQVDKFYQNLPACFKDTTEISCDPARDRYGFQAANITATVQLLRMMLLASETNSIEQRCKVVSEVVNAFMRVPVAYLRAISSPLLHHLAGIGSVLGGVLGEPFNEYQYQEVRTVLLSLAQLLENLNHGIHSTKVVQKLRDLILQIDAHMISLQHQSVHVGTSRPVTTTEPSPSQTSNSGNWEELEPYMQLPADLLVDWPWKSGFMHLTGS